MHSLGFEITCDHSENGKLVVTLAGAAPVGPSLFGIQLLRIDDFEAGRSVSADDRDV